MEPKRQPNYADTAYREAASRLRIILAEPYAPMNKLSIRELDSPFEDTDNQSLHSAASKLSKPATVQYRYSPSISRRYPYSNVLKTGWKDPDHFVK